MDIIHNSVHPEECFSHIVSCLVNSSILNFLQFCLYKQRQEQEVTVLLSLQRSMQIPLLSRTMAQLAYEGIITTAI